jgi:hypothetical protein
MVARSKGPLLLKLVDAYESEHFPLTGMEGGLELVWL